VIIGAGASPIDLIAGDDGSLTAVPGGASQDLRAARAAATFGTMVAELTCGRAGADPPRAAELPAAGTVA
jgi:hypothetical protein